MPQPTVKKVSNTELREFDRVISGVLDKLIVAVVPTTGALVASAQLRISRPYIGQIRSVFVDDDHRGTGIATRLLNRCFAVAEECGLDCTALMVNKTNVQAIRLYRKLGFFVAASFDDGDLLMARPLPKL